VAAASARAELSANPSGCSNFEPNLFRRERCKHCGRSWTLHAGAISDEALVENQQRMAEAASSQLGRQAAAKAQARAKTQARLVRERAVEDSWLFGDPNDVGSDEILDASSDGDSDRSGFRMFFSSDLAGGGARPEAADRASSLGRLPTVVNLIDFRECNVADDRPRAPAPADVADAAGQTAFAISPSPTSAASWLAGGFARDAAGAKASSSSSAAAASSSSATVAGASAARSSPRGRSSPTPVPSAGQGGLPTGLRRDGDSMPSASSAPARLQVACISATQTECEEDARGQLGRQLNEGTGKRQEQALLEEVQYLRQMLADADEEKRIQLAIVRDELAEMQRVMDPSSDANVHARKKQCSAQEVQDATDRLRAGFELELDAHRAEVEQIRHELDTCRKSEMSIRLAVSSLVHQTQVLTDKLQDRERSLNEMKRISDQNMRKARELEVELRETRSQLSLYEVTDESLRSAGTETVVVEWEQKLRATANAALQRLAERRIELRVAAHAVAAAESSLCKICFDRPSSCALLPCRHHAFCTVCARAVLNGAAPSCPLCRSKVSDLFETYAG